jgi:hypothetical protein
MKTKSLMILLILITPVGQAQTSRSSSAASYVERGRWCDPQMMQSPNFPFVPSNIDLALDSAQSLQLGANERIKARGTSPGGRVGLALKNPKNMGLRPACSPRRTIPVWKM